MPTMTETRDHITALVDAGRPLDEIETDVLEPAVMTEDERAALWLYAWSRRRRLDRAVQRRRFPLDGQDEHRY
jgi:hypothetical protein